MSIRDRPSALHARPPSVEVCGRTIAARAEVPSFATSMTGRITAWNDLARELLGHRDEWILGSNVNTSLRPKDIFGNAFPLGRVPFLDTALCGKPINPFDITLRSSSGRAVPVTVSIVVVLGRSPEEHEVVFLLRERSRRRRGDELLDALTRTPEWRRMKTSEQPACGITGRQMEVLRLLAEGGSPQEIAVRLSRSVHTVRNHIQALSRHLDAHSIAETVAKAYKTGII